MKSKILFIFSFFLLSGVFAQHDLTFNHLGQKEGLNAEFISYMMKDSRGFLWLCSNFGLIRYDGKEFYNFRNSFVDTTSISNDNVAHVIEDHTGHLWVSTNQGLNQFDLTTQLFTRFEHNPYNNNSIASSEVIRTIIDPDGKVWIGTTTGFSLYLGNGKFKNWSDFHGTSRPYKYTAHGIVQDKKDKNLLWIAGAGGLFSFRKDTEQFKEHQPPIQSDYEDKSKAQRKSFIRLFIDNDNTLWLGNNFGEIFHFNPATIQWTMKSFREKGMLYCTINCITPYDNNRLWICTGSKINSKTIHVLNKKTLALQPFPTDSVNHNFEIEADGVNHIFRDKEGITWFSRSRSICKLDPYLQYFSYRQLANFTNSHEPGWVSSIVETEEHLIMSLDGALYKINKTTNEPKVIRSSANVSHLCLDESSKTVWVVSSAGLQEYNIQTNTIIPFSTTQNLPFKGNSITAMHRDRQGNVWASLYMDGLHRLDKGKKIWKEYTGELTSTKNSPQQLKIYDIEEDKNGTIWVATHAGIRLLNGKSGKLINLHDYIEGGDKLLSMKALNLTKDKDGNIWVGSLGNGIVGVKIDSLANRLYWAYGTKDGLCDNNISEVTFDSQGVIWATSHRGLISIDPVNNKIQNYFASDGLVSDQLNSFPILGSKNGNVYLGTLDGFQVFNPTTFIKKTLVPKVYLKKTNKPSAIGLDSIDMKKNLTLTYDQNEVVFSFNSMNFSKPEANRYKYKLSGFQEYWVTASANKNSVSYNNLVPGTYIFTVKASNHDGAWNETGASIKFVILPPPWKTWWAYSLYTIAFVSLLIIGRNEIVKRERLKGKIKLKELEAEKYHELDTIKSRFFANISHEFRTPLTLILGPIEKRLSSVHEDQDKTELSMMHRNASRLLILVNQLLDLSRLEAGTLKLQCRYGSLNHFINSISNQFSSMAASKKIDFAISASKDISLYFDHDKLEKIITNLLSNAYKFTPGEGSITLTLDQYAPTKSFTQGFAEIAVWDTGKGIENEHIPKIFDRFFQADSSSTRGYEGAGIGLALTKELVELHGGTISVTSVKNEGSCFAVKLPLGHVHLKPDELLAPLEEPTQMETFPTDVPTPASVGIDHSLLPKILIVEDNTDLRTYLRNNFNGLFSVQEAGNGEEGFTKAVQEIPDLVISDLMMPLMDGYQLCKKIKGDERTSHIPVILLTAKANLSAKIEGLEAGADDYLPKPFDWTELHTRIKNLIDIRKKLQEKFAQQMNLKPTEVTVQSTEDRFLKKVLTIVESNLSNPGFSVESLAEEAAMSNVQLYRKLKALTNQTPNELIRNFRLERAASLLKQHAGGVAEIAYQVGFNNLSYFAKCFKEKFGITPSEFQK
ncbi:MAG: two-component regulator propeller domain-containing protein [Cyclobacteriaceae bacterium]